jgi:helicase
MMILVQPQKGGSYKLLFFDGRNPRGAAFVEMMETPRGPRPTRYRVKWGTKKEYHHTPSKELIAQLRDADVRMVKPDPVFQTFLAGFQIRAGIVDACRMCLLDERYMPLDDNNTVVFPISAGWGGTGSPTSRICSTGSVTLTGSLQPFSPRR